MKNVGGAKSFNAVPTAAGVARRPSSSGAEALTNAELNRALLARQFLLQRKRITVEAALEQLIGLQAQEPKDPYVALWNRLQDFKPASLSRLLENRKAVRVALMRSTIHLVTARDCLSLRPLLQTVVEGVQRGSWSKRWKGLDLAKVAAAGEKILEAEPLTLAQIGERLHERWPDHEPAALAQVVRARVALVQVPPRGLWGKSGVARHATAESWLDAKSVRSAGPADLVRRYLAAFGPASVQDAQAWCGLTRLREVFEGLQPDLVTFAAPHGTMLFDLPRAPRPAADAPAEPRFLPQYDNVFLAHRDRSRMVGPGLSEQKFAATSNTAVRFVLIEGVIAATYAIEQEKRVARLNVRPFKPPPREQRRLVAEEGARLLEFLAPDVPEKKVQVV